MGETVVKIIHKSPFQAPQYQTEHSAGVDLTANLKEAITLKPLERKLIPTGIYLELPTGCEAQIRPRSGLAFKHGLTVLNSPGTIDADYRGEVGVLLINLGQESFTIQPGERVAQMVIAKYEKVSFATVTEISETLRGEGGFGHTGK